MKDTDPGGETDVLGARGRRARRRLGGGRLGGLGRGAGWAPVSIHCTWAAVSVAEPSRGSRCTDSRRSLPKRRTETLKQEASTPWRRLSQSSVARARGS